LSAAECHGCLLLCSVSRQATQADQHDVRQCHASVVSSFYNGNAMFRGRTLSVYSTMTALLTEFHVISDSSVCLPFTNYDRFHFHRDSRDFTVNPPLLLPIYSSYYHAGLLAAAADIALLAAAAAAAVRVAVALIVLLRPPRGRREERPPVPPQRQAPVGLLHAVALPGEEPHQHPRLPQRVRPQRHAGQPRAPQPLPPPPQRLVPLPPLRALAAHDVADLALQVRLGRRVARAAARRVQGVEHRRVVEERLREPVQEPRLVVVGLLLHHREHPGAQGGHAVEDGVDGRPGVGRGRVGDQAVELEHGVDGDGLALRHLQHPGADLVEAVGGHAAEGEVNAHGARQVGEADADVAEVVAPRRGGRANAGETEERRPAGAEREGLDQRGPLEALHEVEVDDVDVPAALDGLQDSLVGREVRELEVGPRLVEAVVEEGVVGVRGGGLRRRRRRRRGREQPPGQRGGEVDGDAADAGGRRDGGKRGVRVGQVRGGARVVPGLDGAGAAHEEVHEADARGLLLLPPHRRQRRGEIGQLQLRRVHVGGRARVVRHPGVGHHGGQRGQGGGVEPRVRGPLEGERAAHGHGSVGGEVACAARGQQSDGFAPRGR
jgi:hypothetical protein